MFLHSCLIPIDIAHAKPHPLIILKIDGIPQFPMRLEILNKCFENRILGYRLRIPNKTDKPPGASNSHVHSSFISQKSDNFLRVASHHRYNYTLFFSALKPIDSGNLDCFSLEELFYEVDLSVVWGDNTNLLGFEIVVF